MRIGRRGSAHNSTFLRRFSDLRNWGPSRDQDLGSDPATRDQPLAPSLPGVPRPLPLPCLARATQPPGTAWLSLSAPPLTHRSEATRPLTGTLLAAASRPSSVPDAV